MTEAPTPTIEAPQAPEKEAPAPASKGHEETIEDAKKESYPKVRDALEKAISLSKGKEAGDVSSDARPKVEAVAAPKFPVSWPRELKEALKSQPPHVLQKLVSWGEKRDTDAQSTIDEAMERAQYGEAVRGLFDEYQDYFRATGVTDPSDAFKNLIAADLYLQQDPVGALKWLAESKGIRLNDLVKAQHTYPSHLNHANVALQQRLQGLEGQLKNFIEAEQRKFTNSIESEISAFVNAQDESGAPLRPYLHDDELKDEIGRDMEIFAEKTLTAHPKTPVAEVLSQAYTKAIRANDAAWKREQEKQTEAKTKELQVKAKKAKDASSSVHGAPQGDTEWTPSGKSRRDIIAHLYNEANR